MRRLVPVLVSLLLLLGSGVGQVVSAAAATATSSTPLGVSTRATAVAPGAAYATMHTRFSTPSRVWTSEDSVTARWADEGTERVLDLSLRSESEYVDLRLAAPRGEGLAVGAQRNVVGPAERRGPQAGMLLLRDGVRCPEVAGRFEVLKLSDDLSTVWVTYALRCLGSGSTTFGEVRIGGPAQGPVEVPVSAVTWPDEEPGQSGWGVPVVVLNRGSTPVEVSAALAGASSTEPGPPAFDLLHSTCGTVAPGADCQVRLAFDPESSGLHRDALVLSIGERTHRVELDGRGRKGLTEFVLHSARGTERATFDSADIEVVGDASTLRMRTFAELPDEAGNSFLLVNAPNGGLQAGRTYTDVVGFPDGTHPALFLPRSICPRSRDFTVHEARYGEDGELLSIALTFGVCEGQERVTGALHWEADERHEPEPAPRPVLAPVTQLDADPHVAGADLTWLDPAQATFETTVVRVGARPPTGPRDGRGVYVGTEGRVHLGGLRPGRDHHVAVFAVDDRGEATEPARVVLRGSRLTAERWYVDPVRGAGVRGRLTDVRGKGVGGQIVTIYVSRAGREWRPVEVGTDARGRYELRLLVARPVTVRAVYDVDRQLYGAAHLSAATERVLLRRR